MNDTYQSVLRRKGGASVRVIMITAIISLTSACAGSSGPSAGEIEKAARAYVKTHAGNIVEMASFKKTDGLLQQDGTYIADYAAEITFNACGYWRRNEALTHLTWAIKLIEDCMDGGFKLKPGVMRKNGSGPLIGIGYHTAVTGKAELVKKESGWQVESATADVVE